MKKFDYSTLKTTKYDMETLRLVSKIYQYKDKEYDLKIVQKLHKASMLQSTYASNAIEDITTTYVRLKKLCLNQVNPKNQAEQIMKGYSDVLQIIESNYTHIPLQSHYLLQMHKDLYKYSSMEAGIFKNIQNYINAQDENGTPHTLFTPMTPYETLEAIDLICDSYNQCILENEIEPLILIPTFIHDFLCIHPFLHGSGKMSRLLMNLLLLRSGYQIGMYVSLENKILEKKQAYYHALMKAHQQWNTDQENDQEFIKFMLHIILESYEEFDEIMQSGKTKQSSYELVSNTIQKFSTFKKRDIVQYCPTISQKSIEVCLKKLVNQNYIQKHGIGKATYYTLNGGKTDENPII